MNTHPIGIRSLPAEHLACWSCGTPTDDTDPTLFPVSARVVIRSIGTDIVQANGEIPFGTCPACRTRREAADTIVASCRQARRWYGSVLGDRINTALIVLDALHQPRPDEWTLDDIQQALNRLEHPGRRLTWANRYSPVRDADAATGTCATERFAYARIEDLDTARHAVREWLVDRRPPYPIPHPDSGGCLTCGVNTHTGRRPSEAWVQVTGRKRRGYLCRTCAHHYDGQTIGKSLASACLADVLDPDKAIRRRHPGRPIFSKLRLWIDTGRAPSPTPWAHVNLPAAAETLARW